MKQAPTNVLDAEKRFTSERAWIVDGRVHAQPFVVRSSSSKFDSRCGWPAFSSAAGQSVRREQDVDGRRTEIVCANCDGHLGGLIYFWLNEQSLDECTYLSLQVTCSKVKVFGTPMEKRFMNGIVSILPLWHLRKKPNDPRFFVFILQWRYHLYVSWNKSTRHRHMVSGTKCCSGYCYWVEFALSRSIFGLIWE